MWIHINHKISQLADKINYLGNKEINVDSLKKKS